MKHRCGGDALRRAGRGLLLLIGLLLGLAPVVRAAAPRRVVSLVPSLTETAAALGASAQLVGRSRYCLHPAALRRLPDVGGYLDPAWEALLGLRPDLVLLTPQSRETSRRLRQLRVPVLEISQDRLPEIWAGMETLAAALGHPGRGARLADSLRAELRALGRRPAGPAPGVPPRVPPRVLLVAGRSPEAGPPRDLWVIGRGSWLNDLLEALGARNAVADLRPSLPALSREGLLALQADWIIELWPSGSPPPRSAAALERDWLAWPELNAVARGQVRVLLDDRLIVPGPRLVEGARRLDELLHSGR
ncbi:MAG: helical backbone metal receptor [Candidatus Delongbacteria bacterium]